MATSTLTNIGIATPAYNGTVLMSYAATLLDLQASIMQAGMGCRLLWSSSSSIVSVARNLLADEFMRDERLSHLLFIDADMSFPSDDLMRMLAAMPSLDASDVIAAMSPRKRIHWDNVAAAARAHPELTGKQLSQLSGSFENMFSPVSGRMEEIHEDRPIELLAIGTGVMLIGRAAFQRLIDAGVPRVLMGSEKKPVHAFFDNSVVDGMHIGEDITFCANLRAAGGRVWGAPWFRMTHSGTHDYFGHINSIREAGLSV